MAFVRREGRIRKAGEKSVWFERGRGLRNKVKIGGPDHACSYEPPDIGTRY